MTILDFRLTIGGIWLLLLLAGGCATVDLLPTPAVVAAVPTDAPTETPLPPSPTTTATPTATPPPTATATATPTPCPPGRMEQSSLTSIYGGEMTFRVYLPPCYGENGRSYPTLTLLGGNIHDDSIWDELGADEALETAVLSGELPPFILILPAGGSLANNTSGGPGSYESFILLELLPLVESNYCASSLPEHRAIGGLSRGGYWALEIAFRFPELFASVGGHSAALLDTYAGPAINPQFTGLTQPLGDLRIYFDIGSNDYVIYNIQRLHEQMSEQGVAHTWVLNEGGAHENAYWSAHVADYLRWYAEPWSDDPAAYPACS